MSFQFRPATSEDEPFLRRLFVSAREGLFANLPLPEAQLSQMVDLQYKARAQSYQTKFPHAEVRLILSDGEDAGALWLDRAELSWRIVDISILGELRNLGAGAWAIGEVFNEAGRTPIQLSVEVRNPARRLYERLGFVEDGGDGFILEMIYRPKAFL